MDDEQHRMAATPAKNGLMGPNAPLVNKAHETKGDKGWTISMIPAS